MEMVSHYCGKVLGGHIYSTSCWNDFFWDSWGFMFMIWPTNEVLKCTKSGGGGGGAAQLEFYWVVIEQKMDQKDWRRLLTVAV